MTRPLITREMLRLSCSAFPPHPHPPHDACHALAHLLCLAQPLALERAVEARERGEVWGLLVALPDELYSETPAELAEIEAARALGIYVGIAPIEHLVALAVAVDGAVAEELRSRLLSPPPSGDVHVLARLGDQRVYVTIRADAARLAQSKAHGWSSQKQLEGFAASARVEQLIALARPAIAEAPARAGAVFVASDLDSPTAIAVEKRMITLLGAGALLALVDVDELLRSLPLDDFDVEERRVLEEKLRAPVAPGRARVIAAHGTHIGNATVPGAASDARRRALH